MRSLGTHHRIRGRLHERAAEQFAEHMGAKVALEAARAEAEEQRRMSVELAAEAQLLSQARAAADEANRAKSTFLANMSHELRTPLNAILGFSEMMRDGLAGPPGPKWQEYAASVNDAGAHLLALIDDVLDLSKIEAGRVTLIVEPVHLPDMFAACADLIAPMMAKAGVEFTASCAPNAAVKADPVRLKQVLLNLLSNAAKFTLPGGRVRLTASITRGQLELRVSDTGIGMSPAQVAKALEVFGQVDSELARRSRGSGLGLPIAVRLVELHGGSFTVQSAPGEAPR